MQIIGVTTLSIFILLLFGKYMYLLLALKFYSDITTSLEHVNLLLSNFIIVVLLSFHSRRKLEREMEIKRVREELLAQAKRRDSYA